MQDLIEQLTELIDDAKLSIGSLKKANKVRQKATKALETGRRALEKLKSPSISEEASRVAQSSALGVAPDIYTQEVQKAVQRNTEFSYPAFLTPLLDIADDEDLFSFIIRGSGWNRRAVVYLAMDAVAGPIGDYARAVEDTREYLKMGKSDPTVASEIWKRYYKSRSKIYAKTINTRLQFADSKAPFWSLLNYGNRVSMSSDRGGRAYPNMGPTRFVEKAQERIEEEYSVTFLQLKNQNKNDIRSLENDITQLSKLLNQLDQKIEELEENIDNAETESKDVELTSRDVDQMSDKVTKKSSSSGKIIDKARTLAKVVGSAISRFFGLDE